MIKTILLTICLLCSQTNLVADSDLDPVIDERARMRDEGEFLAKTLGSKSTPDSTEYFIPKAPEVAPWLEAAFFDKDGPLEEIQHTGPSPIDSTNIEATPPKPREPIKKQELKDQRSIAILTENEILITIGIILTFLFWPT